MLNKHLETEGSRVFLGTLTGFIILLLIILFVWLMRKRELKQKLRKQNTKVCNYIWYHKQENFMNSSIIWSNEHGQVFSISYETADLTLYHFLIINIGFNCRLMIDTSKRVKESKGNCFVRYLAVVAFTIIQSENSTNWNFTVINHVI